MAADALESPQHVGQVTAEDPSIGVQLVDHHVAEVLEEVHPLGVMRQDARVQHVGVGQDEIRPCPHRAARVLRRVAVISVHAHVRERLGELRQLRQLILGESLGGKEVQDPRFGLLHEGLQDGQVVAERLAGGGGRDHHEVLALVHDFESPRLMRVQPLHPPASERLDEARIERRGKGRKDGGLGLEVSGGRDERAGARRGQEAVQNLQQRHALILCLV